LDSVALLECQDSWSLWNRFTLCQAFQTRYMDCLHTQRVLAHIISSLMEGSANATGIRKGREFTNRR